MARAETSKVPARLPRVVSIIPGESLLGFLLRVAEANHVPNPLALARLAAVHASTIEAVASAPGSLAELEILTGQAEGELEKRTYRSVGKKRALFVGKTLPKEMISVHQRRVCPECLVESRHQKAVWDLSISTICVKHHRLLLTACPACRQRLGWNQASVHRCRCGADLRNAVTGRTPPDATEALKRTLKAVVVGRPLRQPDKQVPLEVGDYIMLCLQIGWFAKGKSKRRLRPLKAVGRREPLHELLAIGDAYLAEWPKSFHCFLDRLAKESGKRHGRWGVYKLFGPFAVWALSSDAPGSVRRLVESGICSYFAARGHRPSRQPRLPKPDAALLTLNATARLLGRSVTRVRAVLSREGTLIAVAGEGRGAPLYVRQEQAAKLNGDMHSLCDRSGLRKILACSRKALTAVLNLSMLKAATGIAAELFGRQCWCKAEAEQLCASLHAIAGASIPRRPVTLSRYLAGGKCKTWTSVEAIVRKGGLDTQDVGLQRILVAGPPKNGAAGYRSIPQTAIELELKQEVAYHLCRTGIITAEKVAGCRGRFVAETEIVSFRSQYLVPSKLGLDAGKYPGWASDQLLAAGCMPISGPGIDGGRQFVFRRSEKLEKAVVWLRAAKKPYQRGPPAYGAMSRFSGRQEA